MLNLSTVPQIVCVTNTSKQDRKVLIYGANVGFLLGSGSLVRLLAKTSAELLFYLSQNTDELAISFHDEDNVTSGFLLSEETGNFVINSVTGNFVITEEC